MVLKIGHGVGFKFKPWQAIKITKGIAIGGQVLSALGVGLSVFMQIKADQDEERIREDLKNNRQNIRSQFNVAANELEDFAGQYIKDNVNRPLETSIATIDGSRCFDNGEAGKDACFYGGEVADCELISGARLYRHWTGRPIEAGGVRTRTANTGG